MSLRSSAKSLCVCVLAATSLSHAVPQAIPIELASKGNALVPVVIAPEASAATRRHAQTLASYLGRIAGADFRMVRGDGQKGIAVGMPGDFPKLELRGLFDRKDPLRQDDYLLRSHRAGLYVVGATELAVSHGVWDLLYRLGHRQFFSGKLWEIVPGRPNLSVAIDTFEHPDFAMRRLWYAGGEWAGGTSMSHPDWIAWRDRNRLTSSIVLHSGHSFKRIIENNQRAFDEHPEYLALHEGKRQGTKFCLSNADLRKLVVMWAVGRFENDPERVSLSIEPSDGSDWCRCGPCESIGGVSDRMVTLANEVAEAVNRRFQSRYGDKYITFYAYSRHQAPPTIKVHPKVVVFVATWFLRRHSVEQLLNGWERQMDGPIGIYEYLASFSRHRCLPRRARIMSFAYLQKTIPQFHRSGARFYLGSATHSFGPCGLGMYIMSRLLWDLDETGRVDELVEDFLAKAFGSAREPMRRFYRLLQTEPLWAHKLTMDRDENLRRRAMSAKEVRELYLPLLDATTSTADAKTLARIDQLVLYARYVDLYRRFWTQTGPARQKAFEELARYVYRIRGTQMICSKYFFRKAAPYSKEPPVAFPPGAPGIWESDIPHTPTEIQKMLEAGVAGGAAER